MSLLKPVRGFGALASVFDEPAEYALEFGIVARGL